MTKTGYLAADAAHMLLPGISLKDDRYFARKLSPLPCTNVAGKRRTPRRRATHSIGAAEYCRRDATTAA